MATFGRMLPVSSVWFIYEILNQILNHNVQENNSVSKKSHKYCEDLSWGQYLMIMLVCELASGGGKREEIPNVTFRHHWIVNLQLQTYVWIPTTTTLGKTRTLYHKSVFFCLLMFANTISFKPYHAKNVFSSGRTAYGSITTKTCSQPRFPGFSPTRPLGSE